MSELVIIHTKRRPVQKLNKHIFLLKNIIKLIKNWSLFPIYIMLTLAWNMTYSECGSDNDIDQKQGACRKTQ